ncbi:efflux RND transporter periplasmic adaptor subunit [Fibrobacter succinogenes]|uniref:efflux RND transporter periplasmic adaptor subunit n=1 Tax=Fibrobacter succinogenes TaxID=833 RepID=UPI0013D2559C|nr:efflux RND transporter periplasmic adaptor subunit [Fibrobacter succinogenes]
MNKTVKTLLTIAVASLMLVACDKKEENAEKKASTIEEIQKEKGKPARVVKAATSKLTDVRKFSGTIQGINQNSAICKMDDPIAKINVQVGSSVQKDQVIAEYLFTGDNTQYQEAQERIAVLEKATERMRELHAKGGISQQDMDSQELQLKIAKMGLETARRATLILAPEAGVVTEIKYKVGQTPGKGKEFATIAKLNKVILKLNITSKDIGFFKKGAAATVNVAGETLTGKVSLIPLAADPATHFFPVEITFDNKAKKLLPGMYVTAELDARQVEGIVVPAEAIVYRNGINVIWTVDAEGKALRKIVKLGVQTKNEVQITEGLEGGETVIVEGQSKMNDGDKVLIVE